MIKYKLINAISIRPSAAEVFATDTHGSARMRYLSNDPTSVLIRENPWPLALLQAALASCPAHSDLSKLRNLTTELTGKHGRVLTPSVLFRGLKLLP